MASLSTSSDSIPLPEYHDLPPPKRQCLVGPCERKHGLGMFWKGCGFWKDDARRQFYISYEQAKNSMVLEPYFVYKNGKGTFVKTTNLRLKEIHIKKRSDKNYKDSILIRARDLQGKCAKEIQMKFTNKGNDTRAKFEEKLQKYAAEYGYKIFSDRSTDDEDDESRSGEVLLPFDAEMDLTENATRNQLWGH